MALAEYTDLFWFPSGDLAVGVAVRIFPHESNVLAPLFTDATGTVPLANPVITSATGTISFWAETGLYWMHADSESFEIAVGVTPNDPNAIAELQLDVLQLQGEMTAVEADVTTLQADMTTAQADINTLQADMTTLQTDLMGVDAMASAVISTGVVGGGILSANVGNPLAVDISAVTAYVVDDSVNPIDPVITRIDEPNRTATLDGAAQARVITWWMMDADGNLIQQADTPTPQERRDFVVLGRTAFNPLTGSFLAFKSIQVDLGQDPNQLADLMDSLGPFSLTGNRITPVAATLSFNKSAGVMFQRGVHHDVDHNNPHEHATPAQTPAQFRRITQTTAVPTPLFTVIDPANYDVGGVVTPVGGGSGSSTIQRVYLSAADNTVDQISIQYGQTVYSSLTNALNAVGSGTFTPNPGLTDLATLIGYIAVTRVATNLADTTQAQFVNAGKFAAP